MIKFGLLRAEAEKINLNIMMMSVDVNNEYESDYYQIYKFDIQTFKTVFCPFKGNRHNPKQCIFYHSNNDKRRNTLYSSEICTSLDCDDDCPKSQNRVEQLTSIYIQRYHYDRFKTKYCSFYPNMLEECPYKSFCSFVHDESEFRIQLLHKLPLDKNFYFYQYKTVWCPVVSEHNRQHCVYAHNPQDYRRKIIREELVVYGQKNDSEDFNYGMVECPYWNKYGSVQSYKEGGCPFMQDCKFSHGWKESDYHVLMYKTRQCNEGKKCKFKEFDCPFWHTLQDREQKAKITKKLSKNTYSQRNSLNEEQQNLRKKQLAQSPFNDSQDTCDNDYNGISQNQFEEEQRKSWLSCLKFMDDFIFEGQTKINKLQIFQSESQNDLIL